MARRRYRAVLRPGRRLASLGVALVALSLGGCALWRPTTVPMRTEPLARACPAQPDTLVVLLPGAYSRPHEFVEHGFVAALRARGVAADLLLADAHLGYFSDRSIAERLHADVIAPARQAGYRRIWMAGISLGAFGALIYVDQHPGEVDGIVALAPYLGERAATAEVAAAGGLDAWRPRQPPGADEFDRRLWQSLQRFSRRPAPSAAADPTRVPALILGYGASDRFAAADRLLAATLAPEQVHVVPGGHDWKTWAQLWERVLDRRPWPEDPACRADLVRPVAAAGRFTTATTVPGAARSSAAPPPRADRR